MCNGEVASRKEVEKTGMITRVNKNNLGFKPLEFVSCYIPHSNIVNGSKINKFC